MNRYIIAGLALASLSALWWTYNNPASDIKAPPTSGPVIPIEVGREKKVSPTKESVLGIRSWDGLSPERQRFIEQMTEQFNVVPKITIANIKVELERLAQGEQIPPEQMAVEMLFTVQRVFRSGNVSENFPLMSIVKDYGTKAIPFLLDRLEQEAPNSEFWNVLQSLLREIESKSVLIKEVNGNHR